MRTKIIVLGIIGVIVFIMLYFIYLTLPKKEQENGDEVKLRSEIKSGYTVDEMIKEVKKDTKRNQYEEPEPDSSNEEDLKRIQELIRQNEGTFQEPVQEQKTGKEVLPKVKKKTRSVKDTVIDVTKVKEPARRTFNSIRLVKEDETNAIKAFVHSTQTVMVGSTLKMQLAENCLTDDGQRIRKGTRCTGRSQRLTEKE